MARILLWQKIVGFSISLMGSRFLVKMKCEKRFYGGIINEDMYERGCWKTP